MYLRSVRILLFHGVVVSLLGCCMARQVCGGEADQRLDIYWIDVEGGAATLIVTLADECVLIDTGNPGTRDPQRIVDVVTKVAGLRRIHHHLFGRHSGPRPRAELRESLIN